MSGIKISETLAGWIASTRPKTLTIGIIPFVSGTCLALLNGAHIDWVLFISAILTAIFIQIATNLINEAFDDQFGADGKDRVGFQRALQRGIATRAEIYAGGMACFCIAAIASIPLIVHGGITIVIVLALSMLCGYMYTGGKYPLAYKGLGDVFVLVFYGWVSTIAAFWLQMDSINWESFLLGTQLGLLATTIIAINNLRDIKADAKAGKRTIPVRFGAFFGRVEIGITIFLPFLLTFFWLFSGHSFAAALPWLCFPIAMPLAIKIWQMEPSRSFNALFLQSALLHLVFGLLVSFGFLIDFATAL